MASKKEYIISVDAGNGMTNAAINLRDVPTITFPSIRATVRGKSLGIANERQVDWVEYQGVKYTYGNNTPMSRSNVQRHLGENRYGDTQHCFLVDVACAELGITSGIVHLVLFAPPGAYGNVRDTIKDAFTGRHVVLVYSDSRVVDFTYGEVMVLPEGIAGAAYWMMDARGKGRASMFDSNRVLVVDAGMYTLDTVTIENGEFNPEYLDYATIDDAGLRENLFQPLVNDLNDNGYNVSFDDVEFAVRGGYEEGSYPMQWEGQQLDLGNRLNVYIRHYADTVKRVVDTNFHGLQGYDHVVLIGGGAWYLKDAFAHWYPNKLVFPDVPPELVNAIGGLRAAMG